MLPLNIKIINFCSVKELKFDYSPYQLALVVGRTHTNDAKSNGSGKTTVFVDSFIWALFGKVRGKTGESIIRLGAKSVKVELEFNHKDNLYKVVRERSHIKLKRLTFNIYIDKEWQSLAGNTAIETQHNIEKVLGFDYDNFRHSCLLSQGEILLFLEATPAQRKQIIANILRLDNYSNYQNLVKQTRKQITMHIEGLETFLKQNKLHNIEELKKELEETKAKRVSAIALTQKYEKELKAIRTKTIQLQTVQGSVQSRALAKSQLESYNSSIEQQKSQIIELSTDIKRLEQKLNELNKQTLGSLKEPQNNTEAEEKLKEAQENWATLMKQHTLLVQDLYNIEQLTDSRNCPTCHSIITAKRAIELKDEGKKKQTKLNDLRVKIAKYDKLKIQLGAFIKKAAQDKTKYQVQRSQQKSIVDQKSSIKQRISSNKIYIDRLQKQIKDAEKSFYALEQQAIVTQAEQEKIDLYSRLQQMATDREQLLGLQRSVAEQGLVKIGKAEQQIEDQKTLDTRVKTATTKIRQLKKAQIVYNALEQTFSLQGVRAYIIENACTQIELLTNTILSRLSNDEMSLTLQTQVQNKDGSWRESFEIQVTDQVGTRSVDMFSGGEQTRIAFALRIALSQLLCQKADTQIEFLICDEAFDGLDESGQQLLIELFNTLSSDFKKIFVITHLTSLQQYFEQIIKVDNQLSTGTKIL